MRSVAAVVARASGVPIANAVLAALKPALSVQARESFELIGRAASYATDLPPNDPRLNRGAAGSPPSALPC